MTLRHIRGLMGEKERKRQPGEISYDEAARKWREWQSKGVKPPANWRAHE